MASETPTVREWVYTADASWSASGNRSGTRYHWRNDDDTALSCCGHFVLNEYGAALWDSVPLRLRCQRAACRKRYEAAESSGSGGGHDG